MKIHRLRRLQRILIFSIPLIALSLASIHIHKQQRVLWDEERPAPEVFLDQPVYFCCMALEAAWGRPGFVLLSFVGLWFDKLVTHLFVSGFPRMPLTFQSILFSASVALVMWLTWQWSECDKKKRFVGTTFAGIAYATSPIAIHFSHRLLPPVYVVPFILAGFCLMHKGLSAKRTGTCFLAGLSFGCAFVVYPASYHLLLFTPVALLSKKLRQTRHTRNSVFLLIAGACLVPLSIELLMQLVKHNTTAVELGKIREVAILSDMARGKHLRHPEYYTYLAQLLDLSTTITHGLVTENPVFVFRIAYFGYEFLFWPAVLLVVVGLIKRGRAFPLCALVLGVYVLWILNGPILRREVLYGRVIALWLPFLYVASGCVLCQLKSFRLPLVGVALVVVLISSICAIALVCRPPNFVDENRVKRDIAAKLGIPLERIDIISVLQDYPSDELMRNTAKSLQTYPVPQNKQVFVAFNLRALPTEPGYQFPDAPLLRYPSRAREPLFQFYGLLPNQREAIRKAPEQFDIKVYSRRYIFEHFGMTNHLSK